MAKPVRELEPAALSAAQARSYLAAIVQSSNDAIKAKTLDGTLVFWNDACERMYGYTSAEAIGRNVSFVVPSERQDEVPEILARIAAGERVEHYETERVRKDGRRLDVSVSISPIRDEAGDVVGAATIARDVSDRKRTERAQRLLAAASRLFAEAGLDPDRLVEGLCQAACETVADACLIQLLAADGATFHPAAIHDTDAEVAAELRRLLTEQPVRSDDGLAGRIVRTGEPVLVPEVGPGGRGLESVVGFARPVVEGLELRTLLGVPLRVYGRTAGVLILGRHQPGRPYIAADVPPLQEVAEGAAMALDAARLHQNLAVQATELRRLAEARDQARAAAEHALARTELLARASGELSASLDYQTTLATVARLAVPGFADWCAVDVVDEDGRIQRLAVAHVDPAKVALAEALERRYPTSPDAPTGVPAVIRTGRAELYGDIPDELLVAGTVDAEHLALARALGLRSAIVAPMTTRGRVLGALTLVWAESARRYDDGDLAVAEDLGRRGAVAIDNARLYQAAAAARAEAEAERDRLRQVLEDLPEGVLVADATGRVLVSNPAARATLGREPVGRAPEGGVIAPAAWRPDGTPVPRDEFPIRRALERGATTPGEQIVVRHATEPRDVVLMVSATPLRDRAGAVVGAVAVFRDVTALRDLERERDALLAAAAHDLKNPLGVVKAAAQLLLRSLQRRGTVPPDRLASALGTIEQTATRMARLLDELLDATRLRMGQQLALDRRPVDLVALARGQAAMFQESTEAHQIVVSTAPPELVGQWDEARLGRVLGNLLGNAIKYSPGGEIRVEIEQSGDDAVLRVRDRGIGIPAADLDRIFQRFSRASNVAGVAGSGIGLAGSRQIVEQHGGTISVESVEGSGSTFTVRLSRGAEGRAIDDRRMDEEPE